MQIMILLGPPGVGKGTASRQLVEQFGFTWLSTGDLLRSVKKSGSELGCRIASYIDAGRLVPDDLMIQLVVQELEKLPANTKLLLDGFPRTLPQATALDEFLARSASDKRVDLVIELQATQDEIVRRIVGRSQTDGRADDNVVTLQHRLEVFRLQTAPLTNYYHKQGRLHVIHAMGSPEVVFGRITRCVRRYLLGDVSEN